MEMKEKDFPDVHRMEKIRITDVKRRREQRGSKNLGIHGRFI